MEKPKNLPSWFMVHNEEAELQRCYGTAPLSKILFDGRIKQFRDSDSYSDAELRELKSSLNPIGGVNLLNPPHTLLDSEADALRVLAGNRRIAALKALTTPDKDGDRVLDEDAEIYVYLYYSADRQQALRLAMTDNSFRRDFNDAEKLRAIQEMDRVGVQVSEIASSMGTSEDTIKRYLAIGRHETLNQFLEDGILPYSKLAQLGAFADRDPELRGYVAETLQSWRQQAERNRDEYFNKCQLTGRKPDSSKRRLAGWLPPALFQGWVDDLSAGQKPTGRIKQRKIRVEVTDKALQVEGIRVDLRDVSVEELADAAIAYEHASQAIARTIEKVRSGSTSGEDFRDSNLYRQRYEQLTGQTPPVELPSGEADEEEVLDAVGKETESPSD